MNLDTAAYSLVPSQRRITVNGNGTGTGTSRNIRVVARICPLSEKERDSPKCIDIDIGSSIVRISNQSKQFELDGIFGDEVSQKEFYDGAIGDMVENGIYRGFNGTILAYGQTGSGE